MRWLLLICFYTSIILILAENYPKVLTKNGWVQGMHMFSKKSRKINAFIGIPYAKPPLGNLRFALPMNAEPWENIRNVSKEDVQCPQREQFIGDLEGDEDCLYLNIYTPEVSNKGNTSYPVMIYIHGGAFMIGSGRLTNYKPTYLLDHDIILVTFNYRIDALGFLSTEDEILPGNLGLKDQVFAIKWVKENIIAFGGNPNRLTIFGHSSGGASAHLHMLSPLSKNLINGVIVQSGSALALHTMHVKGEAKMQAQVLAKSLNCPTSSKEMVDCLRKVDALTIIDKSKIFRVWHNEPFQKYKSVIEKESKDAFITDHPVNIIKRGESANVPLMIGITRDEGGFRTARYLATPGKLEEVNEKLNEVLPILLYYDTTTSNVTYVTNQIKQFYFNNKILTKANKHNITAMLSDVWFSIATQESVRLHNKYNNQSIYFYVLSYRGAQSYSLTGDPLNDYGVVHIDDLIYLFPTDITGEGKTNEADMNVSTILTTMWSNFAIYRKPTPKQSDLITNVWEPVLSDKLEYYNIDKELSGMKKQLFQDRANFWKTLWPMIVNKYSIH